MAARAPVAEPRALLRLLPLLLLSLADPRTLSLAFASPLPPPATPSSSSSSSWGLSAWWRALAPGRPSSSSSYPRSRLFAGVEPDSPVPFSSRQMSAVRALEAERPDRLFDDPLSHHFAGDEAMRQARERANASRASQGVGRKIAVRTRYFDDFILDCCSSTSSSSPTSKGRRRLRRLLAALFGRRHPQPPRPTPAAITQVLILGCGMDTRAWRLQLPNTTIVEVDVAPVLRAKEAVLREVQAQRRRDGLGPIPLTVGARQVIPADLADPEDDWPRRVARVVDVTRPVAVVIEGLLMYLREKEVGALLARVGALAAAPGSRVGVSLVDWRSVRDAQASTSPLRRAWRWGCDERACGPFFEGALSTGGGGRTGEWGVTHKVTVGKEGGYPDGANYACWRNVGKWKRVGKTLYVLAERTGERRKRGR